MNNATKKSTQGPTEWRTIVSTSFLLVSAIVAAIAACPIGAQQLGQDRVITWSGDGAHAGAGWTNPTTSKIGPESVDVRDNQEALRFEFNDKSQWIGAGWNWLGFKKGSFGTDITSMKYFTFWVKATGSSADLQINLLCNGLVADRPEHHTEKVHVLKYCPGLSDGKWHDVFIPLADLTSPDGFDATHVCEMQLGFFASGAVSGSFVFDDIGFTTTSSIDSSRH